MQPIEYDLCQYVNALPDNFRLATIDDFHSNGQKKVGMMYLAQWATCKRYSIKYVSENTTSLYLLKYIRTDQIFIKK